MPIYKTLNNQLKKILSLGFGMIINILWGGELIFNEKQFRNNISK